MFEQNAEIISGSELNKKLARTDAEFRTFENIDQQLAKEWSEENFGQNIPMLDSEIPEVFKTGQDELIKKLNDEYMSQFQVEDDKKKDGRGRKKREVEEQLKLSKFLEHQQEYAE